MLHNKVNYTGCPILYLNRGGGGYEELDM